MAAILAAEDKGGRRGRQEILFRLSPTSPGGWTGDQLFREHPQALCREAENEKKF